MHDPDPRSPLAYQTPAAAPPLPPAWRTAYAYVALTCWAVPLVADVSVWLASEVVRFRNPAGCWFFHDDPGPTDPAFGTLMRLGMCDLVVGVGLSAIGAVAVTAFVLARRGSAADPFWQVSVPAAVGFGLLASNPIVAVAVCAVATR